MIFTLSQCKHTIKNFNFKKFIQIFSVNIICIIFLLFFVELSLTLIEYYTNIEPEQRNQFTLLNYLNASYINNNYFDIQDFRLPSGENYNTPSIVLMGCSFTYGSLLNDDETFSYQLSKYTKKPIYNLGIRGGGPREMLYILRNKKWLNKLTKNNNNTEYIIYTYIYDHQRRLYLNRRSAVPSFKVTKQNHLQQINYCKLLRRTIAIKRIQDFLFDKFYIKNSFELFSIYIKEINEEIKRNYSYKGKPTKLVILIYDAVWDKDMWANETLSNDENIIIIKVSDLLGKYIYEDKYYVTEDLHHPNARAWKEIIPPLTKKLNII